LGKLNTPIKLHEIIFPQNYNQQIQYTELSISEDSFNVNKSQIIGI